MVSNSAPHVVIVGGGFAGLYAAKALGGKNVRVTVIDRRNHHTFQPLLYQVALAVLSPAQIASPIRGIVGKYSNTKVLMDEVSGFDLAAKRVRCKDGHDLNYDYLIVAAGATHSYFGHPEWEEIAPGLKTLEDAIEIRRRVLLTFEDAERDATETGKQQELSFVIIGAGPTGVELAGAISDIARRVMRHDFHAIDPGMARVILLEGGPRVLPAYPEDLSASAEKQLRDLRVEVRTNTRVTNVEPGKVHAGNEVIPASVILWGAGVQASPLGRMLGAPVDRTGRVEVTEELTVPGHPEVFVAGDLAAKTNPDGKPVPGVAPAAIQMGKYVASAIERDLEQKPRKPFVYWDKGSLATIGRSKAVGDLGRLHVSGYFAWLMWLTIHIAYLIGFRNRLIVMMEWAWSYFTFQRGARLITGRQDVLQGKSATTPH